VSIRKTRHSAKPVEFYDLIERLYPKLNTRLELFARKPRPGWEPLGNDPDLDSPGAMLG
jgi:N6-adenosine-specific RNA methylase IME4